MVVAPVVVVGRVGIANVAVVAPDGMVTLAGTVARVTTELVSVTTVPPEGAGAERVRVPVTDIPPTALVGATDTEERFAPLSSFATRRRDARSHAFRLIFKPSETQRPPTKRARHRENGFSLNV